MNVRANGADTYLAENLIDQVILAADALSRFRAMELRDRFSLTEIEYRLMLMVARHGPVNVGELASLVGRDRGQVSRTVKGLVGRGWMTSVRLEKVATIEIALSAAGWKTMHATAAIGQGLHRAAGLPLSDAEVALLSRSVERLHASVTRSSKAVTMDKVARQRACQVPVASR